MLVCNLSYYTANTGFTKVLSYLISSCRGYVLISARVYFISGSCCFFKMSTMFIYYNLKIINHLVACFGGAGSVGNVEKDTIISYSLETVIEITFRYTVFSAYMCLLARNPSNARLSLFHNVLRNLKGV